MQLTSYKDGNGSEKRKRGSSYSFDKIYATHFLKLGMDQRREKEGVVIHSHFDKIYATHQLKLHRNGSDNRKRGSGYS